MRAPALLRRALMGVAIAAALLTSACATSPVADVNTFAQDTGRVSFEAFGGAVDPARTLVLPVAHDRQTAGAACGAHVLGSLVSYWFGADALNGDALYAAQPPAGAQGYSLIELTVLARAHGLFASAVRLDETGVIHELESGRPVVIPVRLPSIYVQQRTIPAAQAPGVRTVRAAMTARVAHMSEMTRLAMVNHYLLAIGYDAERFVVMEPVMGLRTISRERLARYRAPFADAALVASRAASGA